MQKKRKNTQKKVKSKQQKDPKKRKKPKIGTKLDGSTP